jgi:hypothetical protein
MKAMYHPHWGVGRGSQWHDIIADKRLWATIAIVGFITLLVLLVIITSQNPGQGPAIHYYGPWPPYGPIPIR